jgi:hypothetical protein
MLAGFRVKGSRRYLLPVGLLLLSGLLLWPPIYACVGAKEAYTYYRDNFAASRPYGTVISHAEWSVLFGGHAGLGRLDALTKDQTLKPSGRRMALELYDYIKRGQHVSYVGRLLGQADACDIATHPLAYEYLVYIFLHDSLASRKL